LVRRDFDMGHQTDQLGFSQQVEIRINQRKILRRHQPDKIAVLADEAIAVISNRKEDGRNRN